MAAVTRFHRVHRLVLIAAAGGLMMTACGADGPDAYTAGDDVDPTAVQDAAERDDTTAVETETAGEFDGEVVDVIALDNSFRAETIEVSAGTAVHWQNRGHNDHNVMPIDETQTWGAQTEEFVPGDDYTRVFDEPGTYPYYCSIHGTKEVGMVGTVIVTESDA